MGPFFWGGEGSPPPKIKKCFPAGFQGFGLEGFWGLGKTPKKGHPRYMGFKPELRPGIPVWEPLAGSKKGKRRDFKGVGGFFVFPLVSLSPTAGSSIMSVQPGFVLFRPVLALHLLVWSMGGGGVCLLAAWRMGHLVKGE